MTSIIFPLRSCVSSALPPVHTCAAEPGRCSHRWHKNASVVWGVTSLHTLKTPVLGYHGRDGSCQSVGKELPPCLFQTFPRLNWFTCCYLRHLCGPQNLTKELFDQFHFIQFIFFLLISHPYRRAKTIKYKDLVCPRECGPQARCCYHGV